MSVREDYLAWHKAEVACGDIDPVYPVLRNVAETWGLDEEARAWLVFSHVVWYHTGSTFAGFRRASSPTELPRDGEGLWRSGLLELPCETERRGHRPKQPLINHLLGLRAAMPDGAWTWAQEAISAASSPTEGWVQLNDALVGLVGNGRWAAYKTAEMLQKVCDLPVAAADAGHKHSSGPRKGLALLHPNIPAFNDPLSIVELDLMTEELALELDEPDIAQVETSLCDFNSLAKGRYYLGHDIDSMQHALLSVSGSPIEAWEAREAVFDQKYLGEFGGWQGVRKDLNRRYVRTGEFL